MQGKAPADGPALYLRAWWTRAGPVPCVWGSSIQPLAQATAKQPPHSLLIIATVQSGSYKWIHMSVRSPACPLLSPPHPKLTSTCPIGADMADEGMGLPQPQKACARSAPFEATALAVSRVPNCSRHRIQNWLPTLTDNALKRTWKEEPRTKSQTTRNQSHSCPRLPIDRQRMLQTNGKPEGGGPDSKGPLASLVRKGPSLARE